MGFNSGFKGLRSSNSFLRLFSCLPVTSIPPCIFPSVTRCRRQFRRKMWPIQFAFRLRMVLIIFPKWWWRNHMWPLMQQHEGHSCRWRYGCWAHVWWSGGGGWGRGRLLQICQGGVPVEMITTNEMKPHTVRYSVAFSCFLCLVLYSGVARFI